MSRWNIKNEKTIEWCPMAGDKHNDDIEMAGFRAVDVVTYGTDGEQLVLRHHPIFPTLRTRPNDTHASFQRDVLPSELPELKVNGEVAAQRLVRAEIDGVLRLFTRAEGVSLERSFYPAERAPVVFERILVTNTGTSPVSLDVTRPSARIDKKRGPMGDCLMEYFSTFEGRVLGAGETYTYAVGIYGKIANTPTPCEDFEVELGHRRATVDRLTEPLVLDTGNRTLDTAIRFAKIRAGESVYETKFGRIHSPGGLSYYAATWCNDEVEYSGPYFAYTGDPYLLDAAMNAYRMYIPFMSDDFEPIPSSVIAEGLDFWHGKGDRGDAAMYLFGASRFALASGDAAFSRELLPAIEWCAEYCKRKTNAKGVIESDTDEMEDRLPSGDANLCTSSLAYAGYLAAAALERELGSVTLAEDYEARAAALRSAIDRHFSAEIHGFKTYRYYEGCEVLRSWGAVPLSVGIFDRAEGTVESLLSEYMRLPDGFLSAESDPIIWDRSNLYAMRGIFAAGMTDTAADVLLRYTESRLLGERVPYPVEAYPEGGRRHLSGESALLIKVITEGLLGMTPTGLSTFTVCPYLPSALDHLYLKSIRAHGAVFDVLVEREGFRIVRSDGVTLASGKLGRRTEVSVR